MASEADARFGSLLRKARDDAGFTSKQLAELIYAERRTVDRWMAGERRPNADIVVKWEEICGILDGSLVRAHRSLPRRAPRSAGEESTDRLDDAPPESALDDDDVGLDSFATEPASMATVIGPPSPVHVEGQGTDRSRRTLRGSVVFLALVLLAVAGVGIGRSAGDKLFSTSSESDYADKLAAITADLDETRVGLRETLRRAQEPQRRADAASGLSDAFRRAATATGQLHPRPEERAAHRRVLNALDRSAKGYASMALDAGRAAEFNRAAGRVRRAEQALRLALNAVAHASTPGSASG